MISNNVTNLFVTNWHVYCWAHLYANWQVDDTMAKLIPAMYSE